jgi:hypothetical protein
MPRHYLLIPAEIDVELGDPKNGYVAERAFQGNRRFGSEVAGRLARWLKSGIM